MISLLPGAIAKAHSEGLSIRKIAEATRLSSSRVHQTGQLSAIFFPPATQVPNS